MFKNYFEEDKMINIKNSYKVYFSLFLNDQKRHEHRGRNL